MNRKRSVTSAKTGVISLSNSFLRHLMKSDFRRRLAPLQLAGRLEDYLVKEFMQHVFYESKGSRFCECNVGRRGEPRVDIAFIRKTKIQGEIIEALIEVKYLDNRGSRRASDNEKYDEIRPTLKDLRRQLQYLPKMTLKGWPVKLKAKTVRVYGLVFASYTRYVDKNETDESKDFFNRILDVARDFGLQYHDLPKPYFLHAYDDHKINVLGTEWLVSLRGGLWRLQSTTIKTQ